MSAQSRHSPAGRLIQVGQGKTAYRAFVPQPLPPDLPLNWDLAGVLAEAEHAVGKLSGVGRTMPNILNVTADLAVEGNKLS